MYMWEVIQIHAKMQIYQLFRFLCIYNLLCKLEMSNAISLAFPKSTNELRLYEYTSNGDYKLWPALIFDWNNLIRYEDFTLRDNT